MSDKFKHKAGLRNVGSYQVAGTPYVTASTNLADGSEKKIEFPTVTKSITVRKDDASSSSTPATPAGPPFALSLTNDKGISFSTKGDIWPAVRAEGHAPSYSVSFWGKWNDTDLSPSNTDRIFGFNNAGTTTSTSENNYLGFEKTVPPGSSPTHIQLVMLQRGAVSGTFRQSNTLAHGTFTGSKLLPIATAQQWTFYVLTCENSLTNSIWKLYVNNSLLFTWEVGAGMADHHNHFKLGDNKDSQSQSVRMSFSDVVVWDEALSAANVSTLYNGGSSAGAGLGSYDYDNDTIYRNATLPLGVSMPDTDGDGDNISDAGLLNTSGDKLASANEESLTITWRGSIVKAHVSTLVLGLSDGTNRLDSSTAGGFALRLNTNLSRIWFIAKESGGNIVTSPYHNIPVADQPSAWTDWNNFALVIDGANRAMKLYINGKFIHSEYVNFDFVFDTSIRSRMTIGDPKQNNEEGSMMKFSEVVVWNRVLDHVEINEINAGSQGNNNYNFSTALDSLTNPFDVTQANTFINRPDTDSTYVKTGTGTIADPFVGTAGGTGLVLDPSIADGDELAVYWADAPWDTSQKYNTIIGKAMTPADFAAFSFPSEASAQGDKSDYTVYFRIDSGNHDNTVENFHRALAGWGDYSGPDTEKARYGYFVRYGAGIRNDSGVNNFKKSVYVTNGIEWTVGPNTSNEGQPASQYVDKLYVRSVVNKFYASDDWGLGTTLTNPYNAAGTAVEVNGNNGWHVLKAEQVTTVGKKAYYRFNNSYNTVDSEGNSTKDSIGSGGIIYNRSQDSVKVATHHLNSTDAGDGNPAFIAGPGGVLGQFVYKFAYYKFNPGTAGSINSGGTGTATSHADTHTTIKNRSTDSAAYDTGVVAADWDLQRTARSATYENDWQWDVGKFGTTYAAGSSTTGGDVRVHFASKSNANVTNNKHFWKLTDQYEQITMDVKTKEVYVSADGDAVDFTIQAELTSIPTGSVASHEGSGVDS